MEFDYTKSELNRDDDPEYVEKAKELAIWVKEHTSIPPSTLTINDLIVLKRFIYSTYGNMDKAKEIILLNFKIRNQSQNIFINRSMTNLITRKQLYDVTDMIPLPKYTKEKYQLHLYRLADFNPDNYDFNESIKAYFMGIDVKLITTGISEGEIPIYDSAGSKLKHLTKVVLNTLRIYMKFQQEAQPVRLKQIHVLNCPPFIDKIMSLCKPFLKGEILKLMHFHQPNSTTLYEYVPQELLPNDYGGTVGYVEDIKREWLKTIEQHRDYLCNKENWLLKNNDPNGNYKPQHTSLEFD